LSNTNEINILLVEDDKGHASLIKKNFNKTGIKHDIVYIEDGIEAKKYLETEHLIKPTFILLDINLPGIDGCQLLEFIRKNEDTKYTPVIMLTTTDNETEIGYCYRLGCNAYIVKPIDYEIFSKTIQNLVMFLTIVKIPLTGGVDKNA